MDIDGENIPIFAQSSNITRKGGQNQSKPFWRVVLETLQNSPLRKATYSQDIQHKYQTWPYSKALVSSKTSFWAIHSSNFRGINCINLANPWKKTHPSLWYLWIRVHRNFRRDFCCCHAHKLFFSKKSSQGGESSFPPTPIFPGKKKL